MSDDTEEAGATVPVAFHLPAVLAATQAVVVGDFNEWDEAANPMEGNDDGSFRLVLELPVGRAYQYRYLVDGERWENDWQADFYAPNDFGGDDSVVDLTAGSARVTAATGQTTTNQAHTKQEPT